MPKYVPITNDLCLVEHEVKTKKVVVKKGPVNHLWIYDRSGSMTWALPELTQQLIVLSKKLPKGDFLSLGWFSSERGEYNWVFKGFKITDTSDYKAMEAAIKKNSHSLGTTCFSEIITNVETVIEDLSVFSKTFTFHFFTDGYPVVSNYKKEVDTVFSAIKKIKGRIHTAMYVGFGAYYNKELLSQMSEKMGAMLIHSSQIPEYSNTITKLVQLAENSEPREEVETIVAKPLCVFIVTDQGVVTYGLDGDKVYINPQKDKGTFLYYLSSEKPNKKSWDKIEVSTIDFGDPDNVLAKALYGAALVMTQQTKTDVALEVVGKIGDKAIVDGLNNAFQVEEYGQIEEKIGTAILDISNRFVKGRDPNYLPPPDAFCVFDMLSTLIDDEDAAFFPYHEKFQYERIGVATVSKDGYPKFSPDKQSKCPFNTVTWHECRLNLSVQTKVNGSVTLNAVNGKAPSVLGFSNPYPTFVFRNFSFVKDGHVHIKKFYLTTSEQTYKAFKNKGIVTDDSFKADGVYAVDVSNLPVINRKIAEGKTSATELAKMTLAEQKLKAQIKSLKWLKDDVLGEIVEKPASMTEEQAEFLQANGIQTDRGGLFQPPTDREEAKDFYMAKTFDIKLSGIATLPPVKKVMEKIAADKSRTPVEALMEEGINAWNKVKSGMKDKKASQTWFTSTLQEKQKKLKEVRQTRQKYVFSILLAKKWFDEWNSRENCVLDVEGIKCSFELGEEKVGY